MACERNEMLRHVVPLLDALSGRIVTSLALYDQVSSATALDTASGNATEAVSAASATALSKAAGAVSKARSLAGGPGLSADAIAARAHEAVSTISTRVSQPLTHASGAAYLNEALGSLTGSAVEELAAFTRGVPHTLDTRAGRGKIARAAQSIVGFMAGDEATVMAYAQLLADQIRRAANREFGLLDRIEQGLLGLHDLALRLYDGPWVESRRFEEVRRKVVSAQQEAVRVRLHLADYDLFQAASFDRSLSLAHEARDLLAPSTIQQLVSPSGRTRDLDSVQLDALRLVALKARGAADLPLTGVEHAAVQDLVGALIGLEREWPEAAAKAGKQLSALEVFEDSLATVAGSIDRSLTDGDAVQLTQGQAEWLLQLTLAIGEVELSFNPATRAALARRSEFALTSVAYRRAHAALLDLGPRSFEDTSQRIDAALDAAPSIAAGATGGLLSSRAKLEAWRSALGAALRSLRDLRRYVRGILAAVEGLTGFQDSRLDTVQAVLGALRMDGWQALLAGGRLSRLLDLDPQTATQAGVALSCLHSLLPTSPPKQRQHLQALVDRLENHRRIEELILSREDDLQGLYDEALERETGELTGIHAQVTGLAAAMAEDSGQDESSPSNVYTKALSAIDSDASLSPDQRTDARRRAAEAFFLGTRGLSPNASEG